MQDDRCLNCHIQEIAILFDKLQSKTSYECVLDSGDRFDGHAFKIDLPREFVEAHRTDLESGATACIPGGVVDIDANRITTTRPDMIVISNNRRSLASSTGTSYALVVRVTASNFNLAPGATVADLQGRVFGLGPNAESVNLDQFELCSKSNFRILPTSSGQVRPSRMEVCILCPAQISVENLTQKCIYILITQGIDDGVVEIDVDIELVGADIDMIRDALIDEVEQATGQNIATYEHVLFCLPYGTTSDGDDSWVAFAVLGGQVGQE